MITVHEGLYSAMSPLSNLTMAQKQATMLKTEKQQPVQCYIVSSVADMTKHLVALAPVLAIMH